MGATTINSLPYTIDENNTTVDWDTFYIAGTSLSIGDNASFKRGVTIKR
ncbi:MAG: hypothetical protein U9M89_02015 [Patescibacteria group bacterium]|nr:hypothetical protein [Patescibacteria group bacterium]